MTAQRRPRRCIDPIGDTRSGTRPGGTVTPVGRDLTLACPDPDCAHALVAHRFDTGECAICAFVDRAETAERLRPRSTPGVRITADRHPADPEFAEWAIAHGLQWCRELIADDHTLTEWSGTFYDPNPPGEVVNRQLRTVTRHVTTTPARPEWCHT